MQPNYTDMERALARLKQLVSEERLAIMRKDDAMICKIASLLPSTINRLDANWIQKDPALKSEIDSIQKLQEETIAYVNSRLRSIDEQLKLRHRMLQTCKAYKSPNRTKAPQVNHIG